MNKVCAVCGEKIKGRSDKKFCSVECRNTHHNQRNRVNSTTIREVHKILRSNYKILSKLNPEDKSTTHINKMKKMGYNFDYITSIYTTKTGNVYKFVYDQGILELEDGYVAIVKRNK